MISGGTEVNLFTLDSLNINPLSAEPTKWSNTLKEFVGCCNLCLTILGS